MATGYAGHRHELIKPVDHDAARHSEITLNLDGGAYVKPTWDAAANC